MKALTFCIPVYNTSCVKLVNQLLDSADHTNVEIEILLYDDASDEMFKQLNRKLEDPRLHYVELEKNIGRSKIRNLLARNAQNEHLWFLDGDSALKEKTFVLDIANAYKDDAKVVYGGTAYLDQKPEKEKLLRWVYGHEREAASAHQRQKNPYLSFKTNNFGICKSILNKFPFDENITAYGHEDLELALRLREAQVEIIHIDQPVYHLGIENSIRFLEKTEEAIAGIIQLSRTHTSATYINARVKLLKTVQKMKSFQLVFLMSMLYSALSNILKSNLLGSRPNNRILDIYKLLYACYYIDKKNH